MRPSAVLLSAVAALTPLLPALAQDSDEDEYKPELPNMAMYKAMLDANKQPGWVQFREFSGRQLIYFTALQTMRCRLSEVRYSVNSDVLDKRFPLGKCDPQQPFNIPDEGDNPNKWILIEFPSGSVKTISVQAVWADGSGSEIVTYRPCDNVGESTCTRIKTIAKPTNKLDAPAPEAQSR
ncbi:MAG: hypothetical protein KL863_13445 [Rhizobium sp.]|nr:hypothetical protein [Rhizobium sp.]